MFLLGQNLSPYKRVYYALRKFEGVGLPTAIKICHQAYIHPQCHVNELNDAQLERLKAILHIHLEEQRSLRLERERRFKARIRPIFP